MITAAYTICKNEIKNLDTWIYYTKKFDYRVILDTGSTDGTYEKLLELSKDDPNLIIEQKIFDPWNFSVARNYNLNMIPENVDWCLSPDLDEWFSINVLTEMQKVIESNPSVTNISCDRLDIYSEVVRVGPPHLLGTNKIHRRHDYIWRAPIYEHLSFIKGSSEVEIYSDNIYLIHNQDPSKPRSTLYPKMLKEQYEKDPTDTWNNWFWTNECYRNRDLENFIKVGCDYIRYYKINPPESKYHEVKSVLNNMVTNNSDQLTDDQIRNIKSIINPVKDIPSSSEEGKEWIKNKLLELKKSNSIEKVIDIGVGSGTYFNYFNSIIPDVKWAGIEIWDSYVREYNLLKNYSNILISDASELDYSIIGKYDIAFVGDVLEHMTKEKALYVIESLSKICKYIFISIPIIYYPCDEYEYNPHLRHIKPDWSDEEVTSEFKNLIIDKQLNSIVGVYLLSCI